MSPLLLFKSGTVAPPFFITHGLGGTVTELHELAGNIKTDHSVYGIQWKGLAESEAPDSSVEDMAKSFIDAVKQVQPKGPYLFAGLSVGGIVAIEAAARLSSQGERIGLVALIDTYPDPRYWPIGSWIESIMRRIRHHASTLAKMSLSKSAPFLVELCRNLTNHLQSRLGAPPRYQLYIEDNESPALKRLRINALRAFAQTEPKYYPGKLTFLMAENVTRFPNNPSKVWRKLCSELEIFSFSCDHVGMITTHAEAVGMQLSSCIEKASVSSI